MRIHLPEVIGLSCATLFAIGCYEAPKHTEQAEFGAEVQALHVDVGSGDVTLRGADTSELAVVARIEGDTNHLGQRRDGGDLTLFDECKEHHCSVDIAATLPLGMPVEVHTGSGDLRVDELLGTLSLHTGSGDIEGGGLAGSELTADAGSGDVNLGIATAIERVSVRTGSGDVWLDLPAGSYALDVSTGSGDRSLRGVSDDPAAAGSVVVSTGSGDVRIRGH